MLGLLRATWRYILKLQAPVFAIIFFLQNNFVAVEAAAEIDDSTMRNFYAIKTLRQAFYLTRQTRSAENASTLLNTVCMVRMRFVY